MRTVFADSGYWIALISQKDDLHQRALQVTTDLQPVHIVTTEMVLVEVLNFFARIPAIRATVAQAVQEIVANANVTVVPQTRDLFRRALDYYRLRPDKNWSLTDCSSFLTMNDRGLHEALTYDHHFEQAGFKALMK